MSVHVRLSGPSKVFDGSGQVSEHIVKRYTATLTINFDIDAEDGADIRDHPVYEQIADIVMELPNAFIAAEHERRETA